MFRYVDKMYECRTRFWKERSKLFPSHFYLKIWRLSLLSHLYYGLLNKRFLAIKIYFRIQRISKTQKYFSFFPRISHFCSFFLLNVMKMALFQTFLLKVLFFVKLSLNFGKEIKYWTFYRINFFSM